MRKGYVAALLIVMIVVLTARPGDGCGPDFPVVITTRPSGPDAPFEAFARGNLGVVLPTWYRGNLVVAYRYLAGAKLSSAEQLSLRYAWSTENGSERDKEETKFSPYTDWLKARAKFTKTPSPMAKTASENLSYGDKEHYYVYDNCLPNAFEKATEVLLARARSFGAGSSELQEWIKGQDQVFLNCNAAEKKQIPTPLPATAPLGLRQDRAYQIAAALFYTNDFNGAIREFQLIGEDETSPWHSIAPYLAGRAMLRQSNLSDANFKRFDHAALQRAADQFSNVLRDPKRKKLHEDALAMLNYAEFRLHPDKQQKVLADGLMRGAGRLYGQYLVDYTLLLNQFLDVDPDFEGIQRWDPKYDATKAEWKKKRYSELSKERSDELCDWLITTQWQTSEAKDHAINKWQAKKSVPWLISSLWKAHGADSTSDRLLEAAEAVPSQSPAHLTILLQRIRLYRERGNLTESRRLLDEGMGISMPLSSRNLFLAEKLENASTNQEFIDHLWRTPVRFSSSPMEIDDFELDCGSPHCEDVFIDKTKPKGKQLLPQFDYITAMILNIRSPLKLLTEVATSPAVPENLHRRLARATWARAVLLDQPEMASAVSASLKDAEPGMRHSIDEYESSKSGEERRFAGALAILRFAGLRPYVDASLLRSTQLDLIDNYRDNWWCADVGADLSLTSFEKEYPSRQPGYAYQTNKVPYPTFLSPEQRQKADSEWSRLKAGGAAVDWLPPIVLAWAKEHPEDPRIPEALHRTVRLTRYGCWAGKDHGYSRKAYALLHSRYPHSIWAKKTPYWF